MVVHGLGDLRGVPPDGVLPLFPDEVIDVEEYDPGTSNDKRVSWLLHVNMNQTCRSAPVTGEPITFSN